MKRIYTTALILVSAITLLTVAQNDDRLRSKRSNSAGNLKQMGLALLGYSGDYGGFFPVKKGAAGLNGIIETNDLPLSRVYLNPRDAVRIAAFDHKAKWLTEKTCSYAYVGSGLRDDNVDSTQMAVVWEKPCGDTWCNVLFIDGHVEGMSGKFDTNVAVVNALKKKFNYSDSSYKFYLKLAKKLDDALGVPIDKLPKETVKELDALIAQLGAESFKTRRKAQKDLAKHMPKAYKYLSEALKKSDDPEIKERLKKVLYQ